ncbi:MAG: hypothetical protein MZW92_40495 [Comamonadaceae bacterium]|nr:hypothetical protein [Comamonadaceae bacterium]
MAPELTYDLRVADRRGDAADPRQRRVPGDPVVQPRRRDHDPRLLHEVRSAPSTRAARCRGCYNSDIGHDNNRDALTMNMKESQYVGEADVRGLEAAGATWTTTTWARYGARIFVPPYAEPDPAAGRPAGLARDAVVRRRTSPTRRRRPGCRASSNTGAVLRLGPLRLPLDHAVPQHRRDAHRVGQRAHRHAALHRSRASSHGRRARPARPTRSR